MYKRNHSELINLILEEYLGDFTTGNISRQLGFKFDKYKRWLDGSKILRWDEFVELSRALKVNIDGAIEKIKVTDDGENIFSYFKTVNAFETAQDAANYLNTHVSVVKRYAQGDTIPDTATIFKMIDYNSNYLAAFLSGLFSTEIKNPTLKEMIMSETLEPSYLVTRANISIIGACFMLDTYVNRKIKTDHWISQTTGINLEEVRIVLKQLTELGLLTLEGEDNYTYTSYGTHTVGLTFKDNIPMLQQFNFKAIEFLEKKKAEENPTTKPGIVAVQAFPISVEVLKKVNAIILKAHSDIFKEIEEDTNPRTDIYCLMFEIFSLSKKVPADLG